MAGDKNVDDEARRRRHPRDVAADVARVAGGGVPILLAVAVGAGVERVTGVPAVVAGLLALTVALVASPRLLAAVEPAAGLLLRLLPALFVPLVVGVTGVGGEVRAAWPAAMAAIVASVPTGFAVTAWLARSAPDPAPDAGAGRATGPGA